MALPDAKKTGTTSACAENTRGVSIMCKILGNYLRVRGEYTTTTAPRKQAKELPPRARRILNPLIDLRFHCGTTSACAENTIDDIFFPTPPRNYLRVRGEYPQAHWPGILAKELPPRARRIPALFPFLGPAAGTTSACAENTTSMRHALTLMWNYLRVRGEYQ